MKAGEYQWDTEKELRTRCQLSLNLTNIGYKIFSSGKKPLAVATLMPDGKTLDITIYPDRVAALTKRYKNR
jgi:hypothetical protein